MSQINPKLVQVREELGNCQRCKLCSTRNTIVFGAGDPNAQLVFVGEAPGAVEDDGGVPFSGPAGQLLTKMIAAMNLSRDAVYICNVIKCRPPGNRSPQDDEVVACSPFLGKQLLAINPKVIVALGRTAAQYLLPNCPKTAPMRAIRGKWYEWNGIKVIASWHPAYLLRDESHKGEAWEDLQKVMQVLHTQDRLDYIDE